MGLRACIPARPVIRISGVLGCTHRVYDRFQRSGLAVGQARVFGYGAGGALGFSVVRNVAIPRA